MRNSDASLPNDIESQMAILPSSESEIEPASRETERRPAAAVVGPEQPSARREALQRRMPPREGIQAIIDRTKGKQRPWFDDKYDWEPKD